MTLELRAIKKDDLKVGMRVVNVVSRNYGIVRGTEDGQLTRAPNCVGIRRKIEKGARKGRYESS